MDFITFITDVRSIMTLVSLLTFLGIIYWTFVVHRKQDFDEAAMLPFADEAMNNSQQEQKNG
jgi:cytochrome c oxidase cbb3-type subunit 4